MFDNLRDKLRPFFVSSEWERGKTNHSEEEHEEAFDITLKFINTQLSKVRNSRFFLWDLYGHGNFRDYIGNRSDCEPEMMAVMHL